MKLPHSLLHRAFALVLLTGLSGHIGLSEPAHAAPFGTSVSPNASIAGASRQDDPVVARGRELVLHASELRHALVRRYAVSSEGREILKLLLQARMLDRLGEEYGLRIGPKDIDARWNQLNLQARAGGSSGLDEEIRKQGLSKEEFREFLRLSLVQERLTRKALDVPPDRPVSGDQQEVWLQQVMVERGLAWPPPPWPDGIVARCGDVVVDREAFGQELVRRLADDEVRETIWHLLLRRGIERRMPDLSAEARERALDAEMGRRRARVSSATQGQGVSFEEVVGARGTTVEALRNDDSVHIAALSWLWVDRTHGDAGVRKTYETERARFEGLHGKAVRTHLLFLTASRYKNDLNPRTFAEAEAEVERLIGEVGNTDDFAALARKYSEDPTSRNNAGDLGFIVRRDDRMPAAIPEAVFQALDAGRKIPATGRAIGPVRLESGVAVLWVSAVRESPSWEVMSAHVHEELRRRFLKDVMPPQDVEILLP